MTPEDLALVASHHLGQGVAVEGLRRMTGGASRETWSFDAVFPDGRREGLVLRRDPGGGLQGIGRDVEEQLLRAAGGGGVPVPAVRFGLSAEDGLGAGFVMERVEGETIPRRILRDPPPGLAARCGEIAARIHALPVDALPGLPDQPALAQVEQYRQLLDVFGEPHPAFELGLRWLEERVPPSSGTALVHGDFRNGNFVVGPEGIRAVLDWELSHLGDPMEDLGWLCVRAWRFRNDDLPAGGFGKREELFAAYEEASGRAVDPDVVHWWEVLGTLKWGEMCIVQAFTHLSGAYRSVELAAIGRRVCEQEHDLLAMID